MLKIFSFKGITRNNSDSKNNISAEQPGYIKIRNIYYQYIFALEQNDVEKFLQAEPDELIACRPITKNGAIQKVKAVFFRRNELKLVA